MKSDYCSVECLIFYWIRGGGLSIEFLIIIFSQYLFQILICIHTFWIWKVQFHQQIFHKKFKKFRIHKNSTCWKLPTFQNYSIFRTHIWKLNFPPTKKERKIWKNHEKFKNEKYNRFSNISTFFEVYSNWKKSNCFWSNFIWFLILVF